MPRRDEFLFFRHQHAMTAAAADAPDGNGGSDMMDGHVGMLIGACTCALAKHWTKFLT